MNRWKKIAAFFVMLFATFSAKPAWSQATTTSGDFVTEPPTLVSLGFEWKINGDANRNAKVEVTYRKKGDQTWRDALPLMRLQNEQIGVPPAPTTTEEAAAAARSDFPRYTAFKYTAANMFSGSILNLEPDTEYECHFVLSDPGWCDWREGKDSQRSYAKGTNAGRRRPRV